MSIDLVNWDGLSLFMYTEDLGYKLQHPESSKHYSVQQHIIDTKKSKYQKKEYWKIRLSESYVEIILRTIMDHYWKIGLDFSIVDVGAQYGHMSLKLGKYIKASGHANKIHSFDCGIAGKLTEYNIKLNQLDDIIKFEYKAVSKTSIPHLVYYDLQHSEDNHIIRRDFVNLPSYVVDAITLDDFFKKDNEHNNGHKQDLIIKIDAQGVEPLIFEGMQKLLQGEHPPPIIFEFVPWVCSSIIDPVQFLKSLPEGYIFFNLDDTNENGIQKIEASDFPNFVSEISANKSQYADLLILHEKSTPESEVFIEEISKVHGSDLFCVIDSDIEEAQRLVNSGLFDDALIKLQELLNTRPASASVHYLTAYSLHNSKIDYTQALNHYDLALQYGYDEFWLAYARGCLHYTLRNYKEARADLERAVSLKDNHYGPGQIIEAIEFAEVQQLIYATRLGEALAKLKALLDTKPTSGKVHYFTGFCLNLKTDYKKALEHYNLALEYGYDELEIRRSRGFLYLALNRFEDAIADLERAVYINPNDLVAREALEKIQRLNSREQDGSQITLASPVLVTSVPKSGTMLLYNILLSILGDSLIVPSNYFPVPLVSSEYIQALPELTNRVYYGHIWYSDDLAQRIASIPKVILIRDPRDDVVSLTHFVDEVTNQHWSERQREQYWSKKSWEEKVSSVIFGMPTPNNYPPSILNAYLNYAIKWAGPDTFVVRYEDLISNNKASVINTIKSLIDFIGIKNIDEDIMAKKVLIGADPGRSTTFRSGKIGNWHHEFTTSNVKQMKVVAPYLVSALGYEPDENWDIEHDGGYGGSLPKIDIQSLMDFKFRSTRTILDWNEYLQVRKELAGSNQINYLIDEWAVNNFIETNKLEYALIILERLLISVPNNARWNYHYAFSLQALRKDPENSLNHYKAALENGFNEFWVRYHRGILLKELGDLQNARIDLQRAASLNPEHEELSKILHEVEEGLSLRNLL